MNFALAVFNVEFAAARQQPRVIEMVNVNLTSIQNMDGERAKGLDAEPVAQFVDQHGFKVAG